MVRADRLGRNHPVTRPSPRPRNAFGWSSIAPCRRRDVCRFRNHDRRDDGDWPEPRGCALTGVERPGSTRRAPWAPWGRSSARTRRQTQREPDQRRSRDAAYSAPHATAARPTKTTYPTIAHQTPLETTIAASNASPDDLLRGPSGALTSTGVDVDTV